MAMMAKPLTSRALANYMVYREFVLADLLVNGIDITSASVDKSYLFDGLDFKSQQTILDNLSDLSVLLRNRERLPEMTRNQQLLWGFLKLKGIFVPGDLFRNLGPQIYFDCHDSEGNCKAICPSIFEFTDFSIDEVFSRGHSKMGPMDSEGAKYLKFVKVLEVHSKKENWTGLVTISEPLAKK